MYSSAKCCTVLYRFVEYCTAPYCRVLCNSAYYYTIQYSALWYSTVQLHCTNVRKAHSNWTDDKRIHANDYQKVQQLMYRTDSVEAYRNKRKYKKQHATYQKAAYDAATAEVRAAFRDAATRTVIK